MSDHDHYAVFGHPIDHSKSPQIHQMFAEQTGQTLSYQAQDVTAGQFTEAARSFFSSGGKGLNCTVPLKELAWAWVNKKTPRAELAKAVNTLVLQADGSLLGDNTDGCGLVTDLTVNHSLTLTRRRILILGAGGASRGIIAPLLELKPACLTIANRTVDKAIKLAAEFNNLACIQGCGFPELQGQQFDIILNATSASLSHQLPPLPDTLLADVGVCYDLAYGSQKTAFVAWGIAHNAYKSLDGLGMLVEQAAEAFYLWRGVRPKTKPVIDFVDSLRLSLTS